MPNAELGPEFSLAKRLTTLEGLVRGLQTRDVLQNASIGSGGLTITDGGFLLVDGDATFNGSLTVPSGSLNTGGNLSAGGSVTAGTSVNGASLAISGGASVGSLSTGSVSSSGNVNGADVTASGFFRSLPGSVFDITTPRNTTWWRLSDGLLAWASSSRTKKTNIVPSGLDPRAVLALQDVHYNYIAEVRKRDDPTYEGYIGPDYHVATEIGLIAEELHELGLWEFVEYEREPDPEFPPIYSEPERDEHGEPLTPPVLLREPISRLRRDEHGEPVPRSIHYSMLAVALLPVLRLHDDELADLRREIGELRSLLEG